MASKSRSLKHMSLEGSYLWDGLPGFIYLTQNAAPFLKLAKGYPCHFFGVWQKKTCSFNCSVPLQGRSSRHQVFSNGAVGQMQSCRAHLVPIGLYGTKTDALSVFVQKLGTAQWQLQNGRAEALIVPTSRTIIKTSGFSNWEVGHLLWQLPPALLQVLKVRSQESIKKYFESILSPTLSLEATVDQACSRNGKLLCKRCYSRCLSCKRFLCCSQMPYSANHRLVTINDK